MEKPQRSDGTVNTVVTVEDVGYNVRDVFNYVGNKYGIDIEDVLGSVEHFPAWLKAKGYIDNVEDLKNKDLASIRTWKAQYKADPQGATACPAQENLWHWFFRQYKYNYGETFVLDFDEALQDEIPDFVRTLFEYAKAEFGNQIDVYYSRY